MNNQLLEEVLARYRLTGATSYPLRSYNNHIYRVEHADGERFSLRICGFPTMKRRSMEDEMRWLEFVAQRDPRLAPRPIANEGGELVTTISAPEREWLCCLFAWIEGEEVGNGAKPAQMRKIGQTVATLHDIARQFPFSHASSDFRSGYRYDQSLMRSHHDWISEHRHGIGAEKVALLARAIDYVIAQLDRLGTTTANYGAIHADLGLSNLLVHDDEIYVMDFEQMGCGHYLYDLTILWHELHTETADAASLWQSFRMGYTEVAELPFTYEEELNPFLVVIDLNFLDWLYNTDNPTVQAKFGPRIPSVYESIRRRVDGLARRVHDV